MGGDFNFKSLGERQPNEELQTTASELRVLASIKGMGLASCWRTAHPGAPLPQTLRWAGEKTRPYHCDGIFVPKSWDAGLLCEILTSPAIEKASDHNPIAAWLD